MSFTSNEQLRELQDQFALTLPQAHAVIAKTGVVRHLAKDEAHRERFVLKGGTLLHGVYGSPRVSIADVDYADAFDDDFVSAAPLTTDEVAEAVTFDDVGLTVRGVEGSWSEDDGLVVGVSVPFELGNVEALDPQNRDEQPLNISVSVRQAEVIRGIQVATFRAPFIEEPQFGVPALALEEALAEKVISYAIKHFNKHYIDLAIAARDLQDRFNPQDVLALLAPKLIAEKQRAPERFKNIHRPSDLLARFTDEREVSRMIQRWGDPDRQLFLSVDERELTEPARVHEIVDGYWTPILRHLPDDDLTTPAESSS